MATPSHSTTTAALPLGTPASPLAPRFPVWRFLLAVAALPPLLAFMAAASGLAWMCFRGVMGPPGAVIALAGIAALAALIRGTRAWKSAWRRASSLWWGWLRWCGLSSRCSRWRWLRGSFLGRHFPKVTGRLGSVGGIFISGDRPTISPWQSSHRSSSITPSARSVRIGITKISTLTFFDWEQALTGAPPPCRATGIIVAVPDLIRDTEPNLPYIKDAWRITPTMRFVQCRRTNKPNERFRHLSQIGGGR